MDAANPHKGTSIALSPVQQGMYFHHLHRKNNNYLEQMVCDIIGDLDIHCFERTLSHLVKQFDSLRTLYQY